MAERRRRKEFGTVLPPPAPPPPETSPTEENSPVEIATPSAPEPPAEVRPQAPQGFRFAPARPQPPQVGSTRTIFVLDENWAENYAASEHFSEWWKACNEPHGAWPSGVQLLDQKLYLEGKLCVPENRVTAVLLAFHVGVGHPGIHRLLAAAKNNFVFPPKAQVEKEISHLRKGCLVCQACETPNEMLARPIRMTPVVEGFFASVALDVFSLPLVEWQGEFYDSILLCVDRATNWILAKATSAKGLTGEKAAHLLLEGGWGEIAIPSIVTSDQGPQFISQFFRTWCARLGVRQAFSQAYRPQANGRAEVAGRTLLTVLRKLEADHEINWVEALPRALRLRHDLPDPETGWSPYQLVFGRERPLGGLPRSVPKPHPDAEELADGLVHIDRWAWEHLRAEHKKIEARINRRRPEFAGVYAV
ncbi:hypothetical protein M569_08075, partial [Genlisea aurea]